MGQIRVVPRLRHIVPLITVFFLLTLTGCGDDIADLFGNNNNDDDISDNTPPAADTNIAGLNVAVTNSDVDTVFNQLLGSINAQTGLVTQVDHQANAQSVGRSLRPTRLIIFDNPARTAPLIQADARAGLDLPPKMLVYQDRDGDTAVAFNDPDYLAARYDLGDASDALDAIGDNLQTLASDAADGNGISSEGDSDGVSDGQGIVTVASDNNFANTVNNLTTAINNNANLSLVVQIDQQARAAQMGLSTNPSTLLVFGNPDAGTPLLQASQTIGIDLPQKMLVAQADDGTVRIYYNDPDYLADRHNIDGQNDRLDNIANLLSDLADQASTASNTSGNTGNTGNAGGRTGSNGNVGNTGAGTGNTGSTGNTGNVGGFGNRP